MVPSTLSQTASWCGRGDLNPHAFRRHPLKMVCLPVPPLPHGCETTPEGVVDYSRRNLLNPLRVVLDLALSVSRGLQHFFLRHVRKRMLRGDLPGLAVGFPR